ncbi:TPA: RHS repeat protein [Escherichia coli]|nr:RHS repeat protein [Escherichia coli]MDN1415636.1 RHS repeat protein [Escherichia coli]MDN1842486.1 RHS repeat protein [Escherichia coli]MDN1950377.1 RHS repeat protein [Escherichia coli]MDN2373424.1 RHS repeat protein [Escherichia coli]
MSGKPAARQGDMTQYGGPIVQGSAGVRIGAPTGVACSVCPGGMTSGNPVNPLLGAKVLPGETDLALPGPLPFILSRTYSSYRTRTPAPVGVFGPGWKAPSDIRLQLRDDALVLNDNGGRSIHFEPLLPGEAVCSRSESMWLVRGGKAAQPDGHTLARLWGALPPDIRLSPHLYLATNSAQGPWWILGWSERVPGAEDVLPAPLPPYRVLTGLADRFGRTLTYRREAAGDLAGEITGVTDGAGREFRLVLTTQAQRAEEARTSSLSSSDSSRPLSASAFPDTLPGNRIAEDAHYVYHYDEYGRLTEKTDRIPTGVIRTDDERTHHYHYDSQHRLVFHTRIQHGEPLVESRYLYDPLGRRMAKRVWRRERDLTGWMSLSRKPEETWYGWDGDRLTTVQTDTTRIQTVYQPGSFAPLIRIETDNGEREKAQRRSLAEKLQQEGSEDGHGVVFPAELVRLLDRLEEEIRADRVSSESRQWLAQCGLTVEQLARQVEPEYTPARKVHFYHCDHRGLPLALISEDGNTAWRGEYDEWGNQLNEENPHHLHQPYRLPGQQHDEESGLYYNRHRHYDPLQGRYITPDPIGLRGGWNMYQYPLNPIQVIDPMGLDAIENMTSGGLIYAVSGVPGLIAANSITNSAYQFGYDMDAIVGGAHNGAADAMRHCYLMCRMTKTFGSTIADVIGKNHEAAGDRQGQPAKERIMDLKNNTVGIACGDFSAKCSDACIEKYNTGQLFGLDGIKADNPIKAKQGSSDASNY